ncbi:MAG TPA: S-layer homology domain-containing protein [Trebonia sp.]
MAAAAAGYMEGFPDGSFRPQQPVSRAEAAAVMVRLLQRAQGR